MNITKQMIKIKLEQWFEKQHGYFAKESGCIDGYYDLEELAEYILED